MKSTRWRFAVAIAFSLAAVFPAHGAAFNIDRIFGIAKDAGTAVTGIDEKQEIAIGQELAGRTLGAAPLVNDAALQAYVNRIGRWIASQSERPDLPWKFGVIETRSINAFAIPGGIILITRGLYDLLGNEAQLAGVLGHEIAHVVKRHHITVMQKSAGLSALTGAAQEALSSRTGAGSAVFDRVLGTGAEVLARGLDKEAEYESDHLGVILAARAGYAPFGLVEVLHQMQARGARDADMSLLFSTHPVPGDRLTKLGELIAPRLATLPTGSEPGIQAISASAVPVATQAPVPSGARALQEESQAPAANTLAPGAKGGGLGIDPGSIMRGLFGR